MSFQDEPMVPQGQEDAAFSRSLAAERVKVPAILLIVVGVINILGSISSLYKGVDGTRNKDEFHKQVQMFQQDMGKNTQLKKEDKQKVEEWAKTTENIVSKLPSVMIILGLIGVFTAAVTIFGGVQMMSLRSRGLAIFGSILAAIPCVSNLGCCGVGEIVGIWSLIVLMSADVKAAFR